MVSRKNSSTTKLKLTQINETQLNTETFFYLQDPLGSQILDSQLHSPLLPCKYLVFVLALKNRFKA